MSWEAQELILSELTEFLQGTGHSVLYTWNKEYTAGGWAVVQRPD
jgi:hypothetical protein